MLNRSFIFAKGVTEELERALWARGVASWEVLRAHPGEAAEVIGLSKAQKLVEAVAEAQHARDQGDLAWFRANWPKHEIWRLWQGLCPPEQVALIDIETTGLTPGYDQITVIGLADSNGSRAFVAGKPQPGDDLLTAFTEIIRPYRLLVTFNGTQFDVPFIEKHFRDANFRFEMPHFDLLPPARSIGMNGGLKDMEKQLGIVRSADIKDMRGMEAIQLWGQWKNGDIAAYRKLTAYCKADCVNLYAFAEAIYRRKWATIHAAHVRDVDFAKLKGEQTSIF